MNETLSVTALKTFAQELGFTTVGVCPATVPVHYETYKQWLEKRFHGEMDYMSLHAPLRNDPRSLLPSAQSIIAVSLNYNQPIRYEEGEAKIARYALGRDYHKVLRSKLRSLARWIIANHPAAECRPCVDSAPILEREFAQRAGLGWFGKNTCLIDSKRGSWFFIGLLLTSVSFESDNPAIGGCGNCRNCIEACPTGAIVYEEGRWQVDARRCISYLTVEHRGEIEPQFARRMEGWTFGCDICQEVCPFNQARESQPMRAEITTDPDLLRLRKWPNLEQLAQISETEWDRLTQGSAVRRSGFMGLRRNAMINLQSQGSSLEP